MFGWKSKSQKQIENLQQQVQELSTHNTRTVARANELLTESFDIGFSSPLLQLFDSLGGDWGAPGMIPGAIGNVNINQMFGVRYDNRATGYETFMTEALADILRWISRYRYRTNPTAQGIVRGLRNYTIKTGFEPEVTPRSGERISQGLLKQCQNIIEEFHHLNKMPLMQQDAFVRAITVGEFFLNIGWQEDHGFWLRTVEPEWVRNPDGSLEWQFGCYAKREDQQNVLGYNVTYDGNAANGEYIPASRMVHYKRNVDLTIRRGITDFFAASDVLIGVQKLLGSTVVGEAVRQNIPYIRQYGAAAKATVDVLAGKGPSSVTCGDFGSNAHAQRSVPGSVPNIPEKGIEYLPPPIGDTENAKEAMSLAYQCLAVLWQVPQWMTGGDTGNTNFAQALVAESPFSRNIETEQYGFGQAFSDADMKVLQLAESVGMIPEGTTAKLQVIEYAPSVVVRDTKKETERNKMLYESGIITKTTWSNKEEVDREMEKELAKTNGEDLDNPKVTPAEQEAESQSTGAEYKRAVK